MAQPIRTGLVERADEVAALLLAEPFADIEEEGREWLRQRYAQVVPLVLPAALAAVETGDPLPEECLREVREAAASASVDPGVRLSVVLRGGLPALRVVAAVMQSCPSLDPRQTVVAMGRAALIAHQLGTCWAEAWNAAGKARQEAGAPAMVRASDTDEPPTLRLVAASPELEEIEERILEFAAQGMSNEKIAEQTKYSRQAVGWRLGRLMRAWKTPNRTALVTVAFVKGVLVARSGGRARGGPRQLESRQRLGARRQLEAGPPEAPA